MKKKLFVSLLTLKYKKHILLNRNLLTDIGKEITMFITIELNKQNESAKKNFLLSLHYLSQSLYFKKKRQRENFDYSSEVKIYKTMSIQHAKLYYMLQPSIIKMLKTKI